MIMNIKQRRIPDCAKGKIEPEHIHPKNELSYGIAIESLKEYVMVCVS